MNSNIHNDSSLNPLSGGRGATLFDKIWEKHVVKKIEDGPSVLYIDKHFIHEVTSPQAFNGLNKR
ncbi:MAG TPA: aconitase family protein, partial [Chitinophagaceae bacterium]